MNVIELPVASPPEKARDELVEVLQLLTHKLSQPLTCLRGSVEVALMGEMNGSEYRQVLQESLEESHRMAEALGTLRDVLEIEGSGEDSQLVSWRQNIKDALKQASAADGDCCIPFTCDVEDEVWVNADPYRLAAITQRFIKHLTKNGTRQHEVRLRLSVSSETACLSIFEEDTPLNITAPKTEGADIPGEAVAPEELDWWIVRRTIERYGGWAKCDQISKTGRCYQLNLPLVHPNTAR